MVERLRTLFGGSVNVLTWEEKQGPLLAAISVEKGILNVLLFLIIAVAGFGILAIFSMIVVEKTRDIGILKALGASNGGVMKIFLGYGLLLGVVGALSAPALGVAITVYINDIEQFLSKVTGQEIFPRDVYYFDKIPTDIQPTHGRPGQRRRCRHRRAVQHPAGAASRACCIRCGRCGTSKQ